MTASRYAHILAEVLRGRRTTPSHTLPVGRRAEEIALIEEALLRKARKVQRVRWGARIGAAAAVVIAGSGIWKFGVRNAQEGAALASAVVESAPAPVPAVVAHASGGAAVLAEPGNPSPLVGSKALAPGSRLVVDRGSGANLSLSTGSHIEVDPDSDMTVVEEGIVQIFALHRGSLKAEVAKLTNEQRFIVSTPDAEVEVRGTSFLVGVVAPQSNCGNGTATRVSVTEGTVVVRSNGREEYVKKGEQWPRGCSTQPPAPLVASTLKKRVAPSPAPSDLSLPPARPPRTAPLAATASSSSLAEENDLFAEAMGAARHRDAPSAVGALDRFLDRHPSGHLAENAFAEKMRLLRSFDPTSAVSAARVYLSRYPQGFARAEAEAILREAH